ncbi:MAG: energy-coupling factor transporter transmembrane protein EcfT [Propionibacteriaceae bacterium]|jgi:energy-coupling factor transport system permease protein|nr:energy-coupling factor transporter transmembrane protein EcfT [Propionibacteriaceae bacterium]
MPEATQYRLDGSCDFAQDDGPGATAQDDGRLEPLGASRGMAQDDGRGGAQYGEHGGAQDDRRGVAEDALRRVHQDRQVGAEEKNPLSRHAARKSQHPRSGEETDRSQAAHRSSEFATYHPLLEFAYFAYVLVITLFFLHPVLLAISLLAAVAYSTYLRGRRSLLFNLGFVLPVMVLAAILNPAFNHAGVTILFYLNGNPWTVEALNYGVWGAVMVGAVLIWFTCYNAVIASDKFIYLFGRIIPSLSLIISMALRLIPKYRRQLALVAHARQGLGVDIASSSPTPTQPGSPGGSLWRRTMAKVRAGTSILSIMVTWALENAIETGDSMRARGYGLKGRTAYSLYRFDTRDRNIAIAFGILVGLVCVFVGKSVLSVTYFPQFIMNPLNLWAVIAYACHAAICFGPVAIDVVSDQRWKRGLASAGQTRVEVEDWRALAFGGGGSHA